MYNTTIKQLGSTEHKHGDANVGEKVEKNWLEVINTIVINNEIVETDV